MNKYFAHETAVIDAGAKIANGVKIWHFSHIMPGAIIGEKCNIGQNVFIADNVVLGKNVKIQNNVSVYAGVSCEDDVFLGPSCVFTNVLNPRSAVNRRGEYLKTKVGKGASIGANATIVCGNDIGQYAFIGAGSVVTKTEPAPINAYCPISLCIYRCGFSCNENSTSLCFISWKSSKANWMDE